MGRDVADALYGYTKTVTMTREAWIEKVTPCLVLNKIDRLILELKLTPLEAYAKLLRIVHEVNGIVSAYKSEKYLSDVDSIIQSGTGEMGDEGIEFIKDDEEDTFQPQKGNVVFACALDGWGFGICEFAAFYASKLGASAGTLQKALWGPRYFIPKTKMIVGKKGLALGSKARPMFVQFVLEPLWQVYEAALDTNGDKGILEKLIKSFNLSVPPRELQNQDPKFVLQSVMSRWLPLSDAILSMVVKHMPDPVTAQPFRISRLLPKREILDTDVAKSGVIAEAELVRKSVEAFPIKMLPQRDVNDYHEEGGNDDSDECFLAFARVFSGVLHAGQKVYVLSALYDPCNAGESVQNHIQEAELHSLYLMMGQGLKPVATARAGNIVAIRGLGQHILKSATLSSTRHCWPFSSMTFQVSPTLKVAIEPSDPADMAALMKGLRLLNRADPFVEVSVSARGEHVLAAAGEVHLERCIKDLKDRFAKVDLVVSPPLVSFRETIEGETLNPCDRFKTLTGSSNFIERVTPNGRCTVRVYIMKLPDTLTKLLDESSDLLGDVIAGKVIRAQDDEHPVESLRKRIWDAIESEVADGSSDKDMENYKLLWEDILKRIWALGPRQISFVSSSDELETEISTSAEIRSLNEEAQSLRSSVLSGFQVATSSGPLCDEPMWGLAFVVEASVSPFVTIHQQSQTDQYGVFSGQVITAVKEACRACVIQRNPRIVEGKYLCELSTSTIRNRPIRGVFRASYAVLGRRRAKILKEEMQEGSALLVVHAYVPVVESFGFADDLRISTAAACSALLVPSHWEVLLEDPFFVPKTEEEKEEFGDGSSVLHNTARKLIDSVRRRKGLPVEEKVVQHATKQRTRALEHKKLHINGRLHMGSPKPHIHDIELPEDIDQSKVKAELNLGELNLTFPKVEKEKKLCLVELNVVDLEEDREPKCYTYNNPSRIVSYFQLRDVTRHGVHFDFSQGQGCCLVDAVSVSAYMLSVFVFCLLCMNLGNPDPFLKLAFERESQVRTF
nr:elongation factor-like GTPase 1 [Tanacetum cinerariifolium]